MVSILSESCFFPCTLTVFLIILPDFAEKYLKSNLNHKCVN